MRKHFNPVFLMLIVLLVVSASGCAFKKLSDLPAVDQAVEYSVMMISAYNATHHQFNTIKPTLDDEQRKKAKPFVKAMNIARPSVLLLGKSAEAWKTAADSQNSTKAEQARTVYREQKVIFVEIWAKALELWAKIRRQE